MRRTIRGGMTLVELLVVITIIGVLGGIVALVAPRFQESTRVGQGTSQFKNWLENARLRAQRDKAPRGLRLIETLPSSVPQSQEFYYKFAYVEQPDDITGVAGMASVLPFVPRGDLEIQANASPTPPIPFINALKNQRNLFLQAAIAALMPAANPLATPAQQQKYNNYAALLNPGANSNAWQYLLPLSGRILSGIVKDNDVVEFGGARYTIIHDPVTVTHDGKADCFLILHRQRDEYRDFSGGRNTLTSPLPSYRITRSPRPIVGEPELTLPANVAIDFLYPPPTNPNQQTRTTPVPQAGGTGSFDIMFSPSGELTGGLGAFGRLVFWLRDVSLDTASLTPAGQLPPGDNRLVVLHCRTGQVSTHPVDPTLGTTGTLSDPYSFVRDGKSSNLKDE